MNRALHTVVLLAMVLPLASCGKSEPPPVPAITQQAIEGDWYNTETGIYPNPSIAVARFFPAGGIVMTGIDGSAQYGQYTLTPEGRLTIRMAVEPHARMTVENETAAAQTAYAQLIGQPARVIFDAIPVLRDQLLELQLPNARLVFSREDKYKSRVLAATIVFSRAQEAAEKAEQERQRQLAEQRRRDNLRRVHSVLGIKTVLPVITGAGGRQCGRAVLVELRRVGWKTTQDREQADATMLVNLSAIQHKNSAWIGRYYKMTYDVKIRRSADQRVLAAFDGAERAAGQGPHETCMDTADDIVSEIEDLIDDLRD